MPLPYSFLLNWIDLFTHSTIPPAKLDKLFSEPFTPPYVASLDDMIPPRMSPSIDLVRGADMEYGDGMAP